MDRAVAADRGVDSAAADLARVPVRDREVPAPAGAADVEAVAHSEARLGLDRSCRRCFRICST
jgi:hypothetical protein